MSVADVDRYVAGLAAALRGPRRLRMDLLAEARDSLVDATEAYQRQGMSGADAQRRAVTEFGDYAEIVPGYQAELAVAQGRRTALLIGLGLAGLYRSAPLLWDRAPHPDSAAFFWLTDGFDYLALAGAGLALLAWLGFGWGRRFIRDGVALTRILGRAGLAFLALHGVTGGAVFLLSFLQWPDALRWPVVWLGATAMDLAFCYATLCAWRCVSVTRTAAPA